MNTRPQKITFKLPADVRLDDAPEGSTMSELLLKGEIDGFIAPRAPVALAEYWLAVRRPDGSGEGL